MKKELTKNIVLIILGTMAAAFSLDVFLLPMHIAPGGVGAISAMIADFTPLTAGIAMLCINVPLFLLSLKMNKLFFYKSIVGAASYSLFVDLFARIPQLTNDLVISALFGGAMMGFGFGLVFLSGGSSGGTDIAGWLLKRSFPNLKLGRSILFFDATIIAIQGVVYGDMTRCLYAALAMYLSSRVIDSVLEGATGFAKTAFIISDKHVEMSKRIIAVLGRGVTLLHGTGMYTGSDREVMLCTVHRGQLPGLKKIIKEIDPSAFIILADVREVLGEGFSSIS